MLSAGAGKLGLFSTNREKHLARIAIFPEVDKAQHSSKEEHRDAIQAFVERNGRPPHVVGRPHPSPLSSDEHLVCLNRGLRS